MGELYPAKHWKIWFRAGETGNASFCAPEGTVKSDGTTLKWNNAFNGHMYSAAFSSSGSKFKVRGDPRCMLSRDWK